MTVDLTTNQLGDVMENFGNAACKLAQTETEAVFPGGWMPPSVIMALGLRETGLQNICGGATLIKGIWYPTYTDRGWLQISDTIAPNRDWLGSIPACPSGSWVPQRPHVPALLPMKCPTFSAALKYTLASMVQARAEAYGSGVKPEDAVQFVIAAHNAGFGGALRGYQGGNVDANTTHGDYSAWVMHYAPMIEAWIAARPKWQAN